MSSRPIPRIVLVPSSIFFYFFIFLIFFFFLFLFLFFLFFFFFFFYSSLSSLPPPLRLLFLSFPFFFFCCFCSISSHPYPLMFSMYNVVTEFNSCGSALFFSQIRPKSDRSLPGHRHHQLFLELERWHGLLRPRPHLPPGENSVLRIKFSHQAEEL